MAVYYDPNLKVGSRKYDIFSKWMDEHYPEDEILIKKEHLAFQDDEGNWNGWLVKPFGFNGVFISWLFVETIPSMYAKDQNTKEKNPYYKTDRLTKMSEMQGMFGNWSYQNAVQNARAKEWEKMEGPVVDDSDEDKEIEQFVPKPRKWGIRQSNTGIILHKGMIYTEIRPLKVLNTRYFLDGKYIEKSKIDNFLNEKEWDGQSNHQGLEEENMIHPRDYKIDSIRMFKVFNRILRVA